MALVVFVFASRALALTAELQSQGFSCTQSASSAHCRGPIENYSQPVDIYIPNGFSTLAPVSLAFHFMGYWTQSAFDPFTAANGDYGSYLASSGQNALLILPESTGADTTYTNELSTAAKVDAFFRNVQTLLTRAGVRVDDSTPRVLSGHSGAYMILGKIGDMALAGTVPALASLRGVGLFDCGYGYRAGLESLMQVMRSHGHSAYFSAYNPANSAGKKATMLRLQKDLGVGSDIEFVQNSLAVHMSFMRLYMTQFFNFAL